MTRQLAVLAVTILFAVPAFAEEPVPIESLREDFLSWKFGMFIHFNVATFHNRQGGNGYEDPATFKPDKLDCNQWAETAVSAGMKYAVLTVKHSGGWCLWDSKLTKTHAMSAFTNYKNGKGDIAREFVDACRKHGLKVGFYYCLPFGREGPNWRNCLPPEAKDDPVSFIKKQLTELLTNYGQIDILWFDQNQVNLRDHWQDIKKHVKSIQPNCIVIANNSHDFKDTDIHGYEYPLLKQRKNPNMLPPADNKNPAEVCDKFGRRWFWMPRLRADWRIKSAQDVVGM
ncbi:MAG: alpha-L-fucosidase, partial [Planctomycetales bacterium]